MPTKEKIILRAPGDTRLKAVKFRRCLAALEQAARSQSLWQGLIYGADPARQLPVFAHPVTTVQGVVYMGHR